MSTRIQLRRDSAANWTENNPTLFEAEVGFEIDTGRFKIGNGIDDWNSLNYASILPGEELGASSFVHTQSIPASTWTINHNLGARGNITVVDSSGRQVEGDVVYQDDNTIIVRFSGSFSGEAYIS